jgi:hypothetical protein
VTDIVEDWAIALEEMPVWIEPLEAPFAEKEGDKGEDKGEFALILVGCETALLPNAAMTLRAEG